MNEQLQISIAGTERTFRMRTNFDTPGFQMFFRKYAREIEALKAISVRGEDGEIIPAKAERAAEIVFGNEQLLNDMMRAFLAGDHAGVNWYWDVATSENLAALRPVVSALRAMNQHRADNQEHSDNQQRSVTQQWANG